MRHVWRVRLRALLLATLLVPLLAHGAPLPVVASFSILGDLVREVGGARVRVTTLVGPDGDIHVYEPKPADAAALGAAAVIFVNGLDLEGFLPRLIAASGTHAPVAVLTRGITPLPAEDDARDETTRGAHEHGAYDPHAWQDVGNVLIYVRNITEALCAADAASCGAYRERAARYAAQLRTLDAQIRADMARIPAARRTVITTHDAFRYFGAAYGVRFLAPEGVATDAEPSAAAVAALIRQIRSAHASALFLENIVNPQLIRQIARDTGTAVGGTLYSDALSPAGGPAATYVELMRSNAATLQRALLP